MKRRLLIIASILLCTAAVAAVLIQRQQLADLRASQASPPSIDDSSPMPAATPVPDAATPELLQLRSQVSQLTERKRELAGARSENQQLLAQQAARKVNPASNALPAGYIRRADAKWAGTSSPENTMQSFLWAVQNHDLTNLLQVVGERTAAEMLKAAHDQGSDFFKGASSLPGMRLVNQKQLPDGSISARMEFMPGLSDRTWLIVTSPSSFDTANG